MTWVRGEAVWACWSDRCRSANVNL